MNKRYGMVIDLKRCIGCDACTMACRQAKATPRGVLYSRILKVEVGKYPLAKLAFLPLLCMHCSEPPCEKVCPGGATQITEQGMVIVDREKCIGCRACVIACPYGARDSFKVKKTYFERGSTAFEVAHDENHPPDTIGKCDLCIERVLDGGEPACVEVCPAEARIFGDLNDPEGRASRMIRERGGKPLHPDWGTEPAVYFVEGVE
jgi:molybdopterin-containing oxidoreductase family iron-sulfur binding subunit